MERNIELQMFSSMAEVQAHQARFNSSAKQQLSQNQKTVLICVLVALIFGLLVGISPLSYGIGFVGISTFLYIILLGFNVFIFYSATASKEFEGLDDDVAKLDWETLPTYSVLVPLYKETGVLGQLVTNLSQMKYPTEKLTIVLLLEADDTEMVQAVQKMTLPSHFQVILVPPSQPRTKPKALNVGLQYVDSELCVVYDAEDGPTPDQLLKAVAAFNRADPKVICLQAHLIYHNPTQNLLTRFFSCEYSTWFSLSVPGLAKNGLLFLLGGTSNHFKTADLRSVGAWDPFNVTEDADLGIRIARAGYRVMSLPSITWEEANSRPISWVKQRSRWIKGYMQTYLAHMRDPFRLSRELGAKRFVAFQLLVGIAPLTNMINPIFWIMTAIYFITRSPLIEKLYPGWLLYLGALSLFLGNYISVYFNLTGAFLQGEYGNIKWALFSPIYWVLMSVAAWKAFRQLIFNPHYWEKTTHGLAKGKHTKSAEEELATNAANS